MSSLLTFGASVVSRKARHLSLQSFPKKRDPRWFPDLRPRLTACRRCFRLRPGAAVEEIVVVGGGEVPVVVVLLIEGEVLLERSSDFKYLLVAKIKVFW